MRPRRQNLIPEATLTVAVALAVVFSGRLRGEDQPGPIATEPGNQAAKLQRFVIRASNCANCHNQDQAPTYDPQERAKMICRMNEWADYHKGDKHQLAYKMLSSPRGKGMSERLGQDVSKLEACLNCHAVRAPGQAGDLSDGVTCVGCHGAYQSWIGLHQIWDLPSWKQLDRRAKERDHGMTDLWNPVRRAEVCASCHIGNAAEGKVITHEMYAAGHPPLPGFEAATFSDAQPRHWQYLREKPEAQQKRLQPYDPRNREQTGLVAVSGLVALRESLALYASQADTAQAPSKGAWPDFARFDCYACHHDLQAASVPPWRQVRGYRGAPGRPGPPAWPAALVDLGIDALSENDAEAARSRSEFDRRVHAFRDATGSTPFGDRARSAETGRALASWADRLLKARKDTVIDPARARRLLEKICDRAAEGIPDYDTARQLGWAFRVLYHEAEEPGKRDPRIESILAELDRRLALTLPTTGQPVEIEKSLSARLETIAAFDPRPIHDLFTQLRGRLAAR